MAKLMSPDEYAKETVKGKSRLAGEPLNLPYPKPEALADATMVTTGGGVYARPRDVEPEAKPDRWADAPPSEKALAELVQRQRNAYDPLIALLVEQAAIPDLKQAAILDGDYPELFRLKSREAQIPYEIMGAEIASAKARVAVCEARLSLVRANRDKASALANEIGGIAGFPRARDEGNAATQAYGEAAATVSMASMEAGQAKRDLDAIMAKAMNER